MNDLRYVSRGGLKLEAALRAFDLNPTGWTCADLGCSTGGFTDCLLQHGASRVFAVDTAYGELAWKLRQDSRVVVMERTNALHAEPQAACNLVTVDLGWTRQERAVPAALAWLTPPPEAAATPDGPWIISLIKPHYETPGVLRGGRRGVLDPAEAEEATQRVLEEMPNLGVEVVGSIESPIPGGKGGNLEWLALLRPQAG